MLHYCSRVCVGLVGRRVCCPRLLRTLGHDCPHRHLPGVHAVVGFVLHGFGRGYPGEHPSDDHCRQRDRASGRADNAGDGHP